MTSSNESGPVGTTIDAQVITGPAFVGMMLNWGLLGVVLAQLLAYHRSYHQRDRAFVRWLVYTTCALEVMFTAILTHYAYRLVITSRGDPRRLIHLSWSAGMITPSSGTISSLVQSFFAWRAWMLSEGSVVFTVAAIIIVLLALMQFVASMVFAIMFGTKYHFVFTEIKGAEDLRIPTLIQLPCAFVADLMIAVMMLILLRRAKRLSPILGKTETLLNRLITLTVGTGLVTAIAAFIFFVYALPSMQNNNAHTTLALLLGKLYSTMLLANLNGRGHFGGSDSMMEVHISKADDIELSSITRSLVFQRQEIRVSTHVHNDFDGNSVHNNSHSEVAKPIAI